jgi:hypothetical protein
MSKEVVVAWLKVTSSCFSWESQENYEKNSKSLRIAEIEAEVWSQHEAALV